MSTRWKHHARQIKTELYSLYVVARDPRVSWYARLWVALVVAYAFSPIDLIPDPVPVLADCRLKAHAAMQAGKPTNDVVGESIFRGRVTDPPLQQTRVP